MDGYATVRLWGLGAYCSDGSFYFLKGPIAIPAAGCNILVSYPGIRPKQIPGLEIPARQARCFQARILGSAPKVFRRRNPFGGRRCLIKTPLRTDHEAVGTTSETWPVGGTYTLVLAAHFFSFHREVPMIRGAR